MGERRRPASRNKKEKSLFFFLFVFYFSFLSVVGVNGYNLGWTNLGNQAPGVREQPIMGAFYRPPAFQGSEGKRMLVLFGGDKGNSAFNDVWFYDVGNYIVNL